MLNVDGAWWEIQASTIEPVWLGSLQLLQTVRPRERDAEIFNPRILASRFGDTGLDESSRTANPALS